MKVTENIKKHLIRFSLLFFLSVVLLVSCKDDPVPEPDPTDSKSKASALTIKINQFIKDGMTDVYLWYKTMPTIDIKYELDSKAYFKKLLSTEDKWSWITDDIKKQEDSFQGKETSYGWSLAFGRFTDTQKIFALVEYVYPNTPAAKAGLKRGDLIYKLNGAEIGDDVYMQLITSTSLSCTFGQYITGSGISNSQTVSLSALELNLNPVQFSKIIEHGGKKIGYLFYAQFLSNYVTSIDTVFQNFKNNQVTDVVLDLRYNPGGSMYAGGYMCSSLAPIDVVNDQKILVRYIWNDKWQSYFEDKDKSQLEGRFNNTIACNLNLKKLYVLTGNGTASASELLITALKPYMNVVSIGEKTFGKYTASTTIKPEDIYKTASTYSDFNNWALQPIICKFANVDGVTEFKNGFLPDFPVDDDLFSSIQLGDKREALLKTAVEQITGVPVPTKSAAIHPDVHIFDRAFSKFDANKRELLIDNFDKRIFKQ